MMRKILLAGAVPGFLLLYLLWPGSAPEIVNRRPAGELIVCFGDSLTAGTGAVRGEDYPAQLAGMLGREVVNLGVPGDTTATALGRLDQVIERRPGFVLLTLGGNDLRAGTGQTAAFANLEEIVRRLQAAGALVVIGGIDIPFFSRGFEDGYRDLARRTGSILVPNVFAGIWAEAGMMGDQIHPNGTGYRRMADHFRQALEPYL